MPKQVLQLSKFSGGLNAYSTPRDIDDTQFVQNWNAVVSKDGIIRVGGMFSLENGIKTEYHDNTNFEPGFGLFQFSADYSLSEIESNFNVGIATGTIATYASTNSFTLEDKPNTSSSNHTYNDLIIFIYSGAGIGESRKITGYVGSSRTITCEAFATTLNDKDDSTPSKYIIYNWKMDDTTNWAGKDAVVKKDFITNGFNEYMLSSLSKEYSNDFYIFSRKASISDEESAKFGYIEYGSSLTLNPGTEYKLSFECAAKDRWFNLVSKGSQNASSTTHGDKIPWVQLYSSTVADTKGSIKSLSATSVNVDGGGVSATWTSGQTYYDVPVAKTKGSGRGATFNIVTTSGSSGTCTFHFAERGEGYAASDKLVFLDPAGSGRTATVTVGAINITGLSLMASQDTDAGSWKSGIVGSNGTSGYITNFDNNYISNGDFTAFDTNAVSGASHSNWTVGSGASAIKSSLTSQRYDSHDGTLLLSRTGGSPANPLNNSWDAYMYQDLTLDENTLYHLNFLYDAYSGQEGIIYAIYDTTNSQWLVEPEILGVTRDAQDNDGNDTSVNFKYGGQKLNKLNYIPFKVGNAPLNTSTTTCSVRIAFAKTMLGHDTTRLTGVTVYKAHNDLLTMNNNSPVGISGNPFSEDVKSFSEYSIKFKVPENYTSVSTWKLRLHAGQYSFRTSNSITQLGDYSALNEQEVYFDNIRLSDDKGDTITLLSNNSSEYSDISLFSKLSSSWINNAIRWSGLKSKPVFNYINGMLKISDGNFNNSNNNKLMYYAGKEDTYGTGQLGWVVKDNALQNPPSLSVSSANTSQLISRFNNCIDKLNDRYITVSENGLTFKEVGDYNSDSNSIYPRNAGQVASAFGAFDIQGFVTRYWFGSTGISSKDLLFSSDYGGKQTMIPRYNSGEPQQTTQWYIDNIEGEESYEAGGYKSSSQTLPTGVIDNNDRPHPITGDPMDSIYGGYSSDVINFTRVGHKPVNTTGMPSGHIYQSRYKEIGIPLEILQDIDDENAGNIARIDFEFEFEMLGRANSDWGPLANAPYFTLDIGKASDSNNQDADMDNININYAPASIDILTARTYGNGCSPPLKSPISDITKNEYNTSTDDGQCLYLNYEEFGSKVARFNAIFSDSISFNDGEITQDDRIILKLKDFLDKEGSEKDFSLFLYYNGWFNHQSVEDKPNVYNYGGGLNNSVALFTRFKINKLDIHYYNTDAILSEEATLGDLSNTDSKVLFQWKVPIGEGSLSWGERSFRVATTSVNIFNEESSINEVSDIIGGIGDPTDEFPEGFPLIELGYAPTIDVEMSDYHFNNSYISKTKFYMKDEKSDIWYLQFYIDHKTGTMHSTTSGIEANKESDASNQSYRWTLERESFLNFNEVNSYESETMISQEDASDSSTLKCRYKTSVIANNRMYVGNIMQKGRIYGDRMIKSPIGKYNILPKSSFIDVAINDGDEITALAYYKDKLLQFKKRKLFIINISGDYEFLEDTFDNVGVNIQGSITKTPYGIVWVNESGCYLYDGSNMVNLIKNVIPVESYDSDITENYWWVVPARDAYESNNSLENIDTNPVISYIQNKDTLLIKWAAYSHSSISNTDSASYHFPTKSWILNHRSIYDGQISVTGAVSNMITDLSGDILIYSINTTSSTPAFDGIKKWEDKPLARYNNADISSGVATFKVFNFTTKDFSFGNILNRKKIYKLYITYKTTDGSDSKALAQTAVNGGAITTSTPISASASKFAGTSTACYHSTNGLLDTGGDWKIAELKFTTPSNYNNIYSFQLQISSSAVDVGFEVNDISIVFKTKRIK